MSTNLGSRAAPAMTLLTFGRFFFFVRCQNRYLRRTCAGNRCARTGNTSDWGSRLASFFLFRNQVLSAIIAGFRNRRQSVLPIRYASLEFRRWRSAAIFRKRWFPGCGWTATRLRLNICACSERVQEENKKKICSKRAMGWTLQHVCRKLEVPGAYEGALIDQTMGSLPECRTQKFPCDSEV